MSEPTIEPDGTPSPTQIRHPWRTILRTAVQLLVGLLAALPIFVQASGLPETTTGIGVALALSVAVTRAMADPRVEALIVTFAPWLAAQPRKGADAEEE